MPPVETPAHPFVPGTTGWSAQDLDDPDIERLWFEGRYEIINGVLTTMAPAYFAGGEGITNLIFECKLYLRDHGIKGYFAVEPEIIIDDLRVARADCAMMTAEDKRKQAQAAAGAGRQDLTKTRLLVPPTLIIESISPGHERHDQVTKFRWYAEFGVPNYWVLDVFKRSLTCWVLDGSSYRQDAASSDIGVVRPSLFPGLDVSLATIWE